MENIRVKVDGSVGDAILVGKDILDKAGPYTVDEEKKQLIFK
jgi:hypothetical protein